MLAVAAQPLRRPAATRPTLLRRQRRGARCLHRGGRANANRVRHFQRCDAVTQRGVVAIAGVEQCDTPRQACFVRPAQLLKRDFRLGLELYHFGNPHLAPALAILRPVLRQIKLIGHRQARMMIGQRQRYCDLAIVLLASCPQYCRATPTECWPCLGKPVSSMIQASIAPCRCIWGTTISRTLASTFSSDHFPSPMKCSND